PTTYTSGGGAATTTGFSHALLSAAAATTAINVFAVSLDMLPSFSLCVANCAGSCRAPAVPRAAAARLLCISLRCVEFAAWRAAAARRALGGSARGCARALLVDDVRQADHLGAVVVGDDSILRVNLDLRGRRHFARPLGRAQIEQHEAEIVAVLRLRVGQVTA